MGSKKNKLQTSSDSGYSSFRVVLFYCLLIIFLPCFTFFTFKTFLFDSYLNLDPIKSNIYAAVSAIIALHIALGLYIYRAYFEGHREKQE